MTRTVFFLSILILFLSPLQAQSVDPANVTIVRDTFGVPHIYGPTDADAAYGLAWATCEDAFDVMQENLLMSRGRLGEVKGKDGAIMDFAMHLFDCRRVIPEKMKTDVSPEFMKVIEGYCQGVNDYMKKYPEKKLLKDMEPVEPADILTGYAMSLVFMQGGQFHLMNILEGTPGGPTPHSRGQSDRGSNGMAFNGNRTDNGDVVLVNNSHQPLEGPMSWYEAHVMSGEGQNVLGGLFPGGMSVFAGTNEHLAWMHTVNFPDMTDVYELVMHPKDKLKYKVDGKWLELEERKVKLKVKVGPVKITVKKKVWKSIYGPTLERDGKFYSVRLGALDNVKAAEQWFRMGKARNYKEFRKALDMQGLPALNLLYADAENNIYYLSNALLPKRDPHFSWRYLVRGDTSATLWKTFHPVADLPQQLNPGSGVLYNTNHSPYYCSTVLEKRMDIDTLQGYLTVQNNRSIRLNLLLTDNRERHTVVANPRQYPPLSYEDIKRIKYDRRYPDSLYVYNLRNAERLFELSPQEYPEIAAGIEKLNGWKAEGRVAEPESQGAALFILAYRYLFKYLQKRNRLFVPNRLPDHVFADAIDNALDHQLKHFGSYAVTLGDLQRHVRGDRDLPIGGLPDVISAMSSQEWKKGRLKAYTGDSYIQFVCFRKGKVLIESCQPFGQSTDPESPHFDDQMEMFVNRELKTESLDMDEVLQMAERKYHPGGKDLPLGE